MLDGAESHSRRRKQLSISQAPYKVAAGGIADSNGSCRRLNYYLELVEYLNEITMSGSGSAGGICLKWRPFSPKRKSSLSRKQKFLQLCFYLSKLEVK
jgi:hypothetical protein